MPKQTEPNNSRTKHQRFEYRDIPRSHVKNAPYNPRQINDYQRSNLKKDLEKFGCVEPLVWNEKSGHLVSGHQRLSILDQLEGGSNYLIGVAVVQLTDKQERELNVLLNNPQVQGSFTKAGILDLVAGGLDLADVALTRLDLEMEFGELPELDDILAGLDAAKPKKPPKEKLNKNELRKGAADRPENDAHYYVIVAWKTRQEKERWLREHGLSVETMAITAEEAVVYFEQAKTAA